jgi:hypothetical protein
VFFYRHMEDLADDRAGRVSPAALGDDPLGRVSIALDSDPLPTMRMADPGSGTGCSVMELTLSQGVVQIVA